MKFPTLQRSWWNQNNTTDISTENQDRDKPSARPLMPYTQSED